MKTRQLARHIMAIGYCGTLDYLKDEHKSSVLPYNSLHQFLLPVNTSVGAMYFK